MTHFKSYRFGNVEVYQAGAWGTPNRWEFKRKDLPIGVTATGEVNAIFAGLLLAQLTEEQYRQALAALPQSLPKEAAE